MIRFKEIKIEEGSGFLQTKVFLLSLEGLIFHLMDNYFYFPRDNGKRQISLQLNIVLFFTERIF